MVQLPFKYKGLDNREYKILGWFQWLPLRLRVETPSGSINVVSREHSQSLLRMLDIMEKEVPGKPTS